LRLRRRKKKERGNKNRNRVGRLGAGGGESGDITRGAVHPPT
jgi:hypothetical protein